MFFVLFLKIKSRPKKKYKNVVLFFLFFCFFVLIIYFQNKKTKNIKNIEIKL